MTKYNLGLVQIINPEIHGSYYNYSNWLNTHYLTVESNIDVNDFYSDILSDDINILNNDATEWARNYEINNNKELDHPCIRNYKNIISKLNGVSLEIVETIMINSYPIDESNIQISVSIKKTFWLKILQRKWKKYYKKKLSFMKNLKNLYYREIHGKYPPLNVF